MTAEDNKLPDNSTAANGAAANGAVTNSAASSSEGQSRTFGIVVGVVLLLTAFIPYIMSFSSPPLLDEQFLLSWLTHLNQAQGSSSLSGFYLWRGFDSFDQWGPFTHAWLAVSGVIFGASLLPYKFAAVLVHYCCAGLIYRICRLISVERLVALASALLFVLYPLNAEAVSWLGGIGSQLSTMFFLTSFFLYLTCIKERRGWLGYALCLIAFAFALASSASLWIGALVVAAFGCVSLFDAMKSGAKADLSQSLILMLLYIVVSGIYLAAGGFISPTLAPDFKAEHILKMLHDIFMPVNQVAWQHYSRQYVIYYVLLVFTALSFCAGLWRSSQLRKNTLLCFLWLVIAVVPAIGHAFPDTSLYGGRWLYFAACPLAILLAHACSGIYYALPRFKKVGISAASILVLFFISTYVQHLWNQNSYYRNTARILRNVQKSIAIASVKDNLPFLMLCDMPEPLSIAPAYSVPGPMCFDTATGLLRSNPVPDGRLKDLLRDNKYLNAIWRWEKDLQSFIPLDLSQPSVIWPANMTPTDLSNRLQPGLIFYKTVSLDPKENSMVLETNSEHGPMIVLSASELSPLDGDYMVLEARINAPPSTVVPKVELHWMTRVHEDYDKKQRSTYAPAIINDQQYHKYHLSLRSNGWTAGGSPKSFALGFPAGSRVDLRSVEIIGKSNAAASLIPLEVMALIGPRYTPPYYDYPVAPELGLIALPDSADKIEASYSVTNVPEATAALVEISRPNESFDDANSNHLSGHTFKTVSLTGAEGKVTVPLTDLDQAGVYSIRVIGTDASGSFRGTFSDPICYQVPVHSAR